MSSPPHFSASPSLALEINTRSNLVAPLAGLQTSPIHVSEQACDSTRSVPLNPRKRRNSAQEGQPERNRGDEAKGSADYQCPKCARHFTRGFTLREHLRRHDNIRPFSCRECLKAFVSLKDRNRHELLHSGEKAFVCEHLTMNGTRKGCGRRFVRADGLSAHLRSDVGKLCCADTVSMPPRAEEKQHDDDDAQDEDFEYSNTMEYRRSSSEPLKPAPLIDVFPPSQSGATTPNPRRVARQLDSEELLKRLGVGVDGYLYTIASQPSDKSQSSSTGSERGGSPVSPGIWEGTRRKILFPVHKHDFPVIFETW